MSVITISYPSADSYIFRKYDIFSFLCIIFSTVASIKAESSEKILFYTIGFPLINLVSEVMTDSSRGKNVIIKNLYIPVMMKIVTSSFILFIIISYKLFDLKDHTKSCTL